MAIILNRSDYSLGFGSASVKQIVSYAKSVGSKTVGLTDVNTVAGVPEFLKECKNQGIHPVIGVTLSIYHNDKRLGELALLSKNQQGYKDIVGILSKASAVDAKKLDIRTQVTTLVDALRGNDNLYTVDGFAGSILHRNHSKEELYFARLTGKNYIVVETPNVPSGNLKNPEYRRNLKAMRVEHKAVTASVASFSYVEGSQQDPSIIAAGYRYKQQCNDAGYSDELANDVVKGFHALSKDLYLRWEDIASKVEDDFTLLDDEMLLNTSPPKLDSKKNVSLLNGGSLEAFTKHMHETLDRYLTMRGIPEAGIPIYKKRLEHELSVFNMVDGGLAYLENNRQIIQIAKKHGLDISIRGSSASSLCVFLMQGTTAAVDPVEFKLSFRRFMDHERVTMPDIDIDVTDAVGFLRVLREELGEENVFRLKVYNQLKSPGVTANKALEALSQSGTVSNIAAFEEARDKVHAFVKAMKPWEKRDLTWHKMETNPKFLSIVKNDKYVKHLASVAKRLADLYTSITLHNSGLVLKAKDNVIDTFPVYAQDGDLIMDLFYEYADSTSEIKYDALLKANELQKICEIEKVATSRRQPVLGFNVHNPMIYRPLQNDCFTEIYQLGGYSTSKATNSVMPGTFEEVMHCIQLGKDGSGKNTEQYIRARQGGFNSGSQLLDKHLASTYGVLLFDEQIIGLCMRIANMSFERSDALRSAYKKKKLDVIAECLGEFEKGALANDVSPIEVKAMMNVLGKKTDVYTAPKSHVASYAKVVARQLFNKMYMPDMYISAYSNKSEDRNRFLNEYERLGVDFLPLDLATSSMYTNTMLNGERLSVSRGFIDSVSKDFFVSLNKLREYCKAGDIDNVRNLPLMEVIHHMVEYTLLAPMPSLVDFANDSRLAALKTDLVVATEQGAFDAWLPKGEDPTKSRAELVSAMPDLVGSIVGLEPKIEEERALAQNRRVS